MSYKLNTILRHCLFLSLPALLILSRQNALALRDHVVSPSSLKLIHKPSLSKMSLRHRLEYLKPIVTPRLTEILKKVKKNNTKLTIIVFKKEKVVELWLRGKRKEKLRTYKMTSFSGKLGPKNKQGDKQIPEGIYRANHLNPNSAYYLSIGINYPNSNDRKRGKKNKIDDLGGDIFIHGRDKTVGCIPIGDHYMEEVFYLVGHIGLLNTKVIISPSKLPLPSLSQLGLVSNDPLIREKYAKLTSELTEYP